MANLSFGNLVGSLGGAVSRGGALIGRLGAGLDNGIKNTASSFFSGAANSAAQKPAATDAPVPSGVSGFKAGTPSTYGSVQPSVPAASPQKNVSSPSQPQSNPQATPIQPVVAPLSTASTQGGGSGYVDGSGQYIPAAGKTVNQTPIISNPTSNVGDAPNQNSSSPFANSLNTQQSYASGQGNPNVNSSIQGLQGIASSQSPAVLAAESKYNKVSDNPYIIGALSNAAMADSVSRGSGQQYAQNYSSQLSNANQNVQNALTGQGQQITAGNDAANIAQGQVGAQQNAAANIGSLTQPQAGAAFFGSPVSGDTIGSGSVVNNAVQNALQMVKAGADPTSSAVTGPLNSLGATALNAFNSALNGQNGYNPTASSAAAQQNASQGAQYQGEGAQLSTTLKQLDTLTPTVTNFLNASGLNNSSSPYFNKSVNAYLAQTKNPADIASLNAMLADVKTYTAQILGSSGLNPTEVSSTVNSFDPGGLNAGQLTAFLSNLSNLGQTRLAPLQQTAASSYGNSTTANPYGGQQANPSTNSTLGPITQGSAASKVNNPVIQALLGSGINAAGGIEGAISGIASRILQ